MEALESETVGAHTIMPLEVGEKSGIEFQADDEGKEAFFNNILKEGNCGVEKEEMQYVKMQLMERGLDIERIVAMPCVQMQLEESGPDIEAKFEPAEERNTEDTDVKEEKKELDLERSMETIETSMGGVQKKQVANADVQPPRQNTTEEEMGDMEAEKKVSLVTEQEKVAKETKHAAEVLETMKVQLGEVGNEPNRSKSVGMVMEGSTLGPSPQKGGKGDEVSKLEFDSSANSSDSREEIRDTDTDANDEIEVGETATSLAQKFKMYGSLSKLPKACKYRDFYEKWMHAPAGKLSQSKEADVVEKRRPKTKSEKVKEVCRDEVGLKREVLKCRSRAVSLPESDGENAEWSGDGELRKECSKTLSSDPVRYDIPEENKTKLNQELSPTDEILKGVTSADEHREYKPLWVKVPADGCLEFMMSYVMNPGLFWVHLVTKDTSMTVDNLMKSLNEIYNIQNEIQYRKHFGEWEPKLYNICCAQFTEDNHFYRAKVIDISYEVNDSEAFPVGPKSSSTVQVPSSTIARIHKIKVFYVDFGNEEWLSPERIYPLPLKLMNIPLQAVCCKLANVEPARVESPTEEIKAEEDSAESVTEALPKERDWDKNATCKFVELTGFNKKLLGYVSSSDLLNTEIWCVLCMALEMIHF